MNQKRISKQEMLAFVANMIRDYRVVGPLAKGSKFAFDQIEDPTALRLDYDTSILPPKKYLQPPQERLMTFNQSVEMVIEAEPTVILGVHSCDLHAIDLLDKAFTQGYPDSYYLKRRHNTLLVGIECLQPCDEYSFCKSMKTYKVNHGYDLHLTDLGDAYIVAVGSQEGRALLEKYAQTRSITEAESQQLNKVLTAKEQLFPDKLKFDVDNLSAFMSKSYHSPIWEQLGEDCLGCGQCTLVCPTCFCFNVCDKVELNLQEGERYRCWDSCQLNEFARVGGGENFRESQAARLRHRFMRKGSYLNEKFKELGCVGCGRCARACPENISTIDVFNNLRQDKDIVMVQPVKTITPTKSVELPLMAEVLKVETMTDLEKLFTLRLPEAQSLGNQPGQFVEVSLMGIGEAPISVSSSPSRSNDSFELCIRNVGDLTKALHQLTPGAVVGVRGPFGQSFPIDNMKGKDILFVSGGLGLAPLRSLINQVLDERDLFGRVIILYGSKHSNQILFKNEVKLWQQRDDVECHVTVDQADDDWSGNVGIITNLFPQLSINSFNTIAAICGPPKMYQFVLQELLDKGIPDTQIYLSLERRMKCGMGKCGHCQINHLYTCMDGPVFNYAQIKGIEEALK